jgi:hypothetical protein
MANEEPPRGRLYSDLYIARGEATDDSPVARERLLAVFEPIAKHSLSEITRALHQRKGIVIRVAGVTEAYFCFDEFFREARTTDLLNGITIVAQAMGEPFRTRWIDAVGQILREENLNYRIDDHGGRYTGGSHRCS